MANEVGPAQSINEKVVGMIRDKFLDLIPEETFAALVKAEISRFTDQPARDGYGNKTDSLGRTPLQKIIKEEIESRLKKAVIAELDSAKYQSVWTDFGTQPSEVVLEVAKQAAPELVKAAFAGLIETAIHRFRNSLAQS